jgi:hypothetical protein
MHPVKRDHREGRSRQPPSPDSAPAAASNAKRGQHAPRYTPFHDAVCFYSLKEDRHMLHPDHCRRRREHGHEMRAMQHRALGERASNSTRLAGVGNVIGHEPILGAHAGQPHSGCAVDLRRVLGAFEASHC